MKKILFVPMLALLFASCAKPVEEVEKFGDIVGVVYDKSVGDPISVAQITLEPSGKSTVTGSDGSFAFTNIEAGKYTVKVSKKGYNDNSNTVTVVAGTKSECNLLLERIPAYVTADKDVLDFGDNLTQTTLSFNIVNSSYENLSWHIDYDKSSSSFIDEVSPDKGTTQYGKTAAIVVKINRDNLKAGENVSTLVVVSDNGDGSSEVKVKAIGQEKVKATLNMTGVSDIKTTSAIVSAEITFEGTPRYTERGFVYGNTQNPTIETASKASVAVNEEKKYSYSLKELKYGEKYYVRAFAINAAGTSYSTNQETFTTSATLPTVSMYSVDNLDADKKTAMLHGSIDSQGDPLYDERGFVYSKNKNTPTLSDQYIKVEGSGKGTYEAQISNLELKTTYYARAYAKNDGGVAYSEAAVQFSLSGSSPVVSVAEATDINLENLTAILHGSIDAVGSPKYTEKGFVYSNVNTVPSTSDKTVSVTGTSSGSYYANISGLALNKTYYVRAYAKNETGIVYSAKTVNFSTAPTKPTVSMRAITNVDRTKLSALLQGNIDSPGVPKYTEKGFVYSATNSTPSLNDSFIKVSGTCSGSYEITLTGLSLGKTYYVRAYAINAGGTVYSSTALKFDLQGTTPVVSISEADNINLSSLTATLHGSVDEVGFPAITERGFVYSDVNKVPTTSDKIVNVTGTTAGSYYANITGLSLNKTYYIRAFARNESGVVYSSKTVSFSTAPTKPTVTMRTITNVDLDKLSAVFQGNIDNLGNPPYTEKGFVYSTTNSTPSLNDVSIKVAGSNSGTYEIALTGLTLGKTYYVRAYATNAGGTAYSSTVVSFSTIPTKPTVSIRAASNIDYSNLSAKLQASIDNVGVPAYTEKGFVYSSSSNNPSLTNGTVIQVDGTSSGYYETIATGLEYNKTYYVTAYAKNVGGVSYSSVISFDTNESLPVVVTETPTNVEPDKKTAVLHATISDVGKPGYTECGFVFSTEYEEPTINDTKIKVSKSGTGAYDYRISGFDTNEITYVRAYAINHKGVTYGDSKVLYIPEFKDMGDYIILGTLGIAIQKQDVGNGTYSSMNTVCENSSIGGYNDWRLPTINELSGVYNLKDKIGGFQTNYYWSSTYEYSKYGSKYSALNFKNGVIQNNFTSDNNFFARAVRTIKK